VSEPALAIRDLRFGYPQCETFLGPVSWNAASREVCAILGPNGAGKSTLLRLIAGLSRPGSGFINIAGRRVSEMSAADRSRCIAFMPQRPETSGDLTVREVVLLGRFPRRKRRFFDDHADHAAAHAALEATTAQHLADREMYTLSTGEQQRVHLAAALAQDPQVLVLDEPTSALDPYHQTGLCSTLRRLSRDDGLTIVMATHDLNLAAMYADRIVLMNSGQVAATGTPGEVLQPAILEDVYGIKFEQVRSSMQDRSFVLPAAPPDVPV
jgi:ABC-type cobalamin/Fe3+-siderophores transport system ATPase subunit